MAGSATRCCCALFSRTEAHNDTTLEGNVESLAHAELALLGGSQGDAAVGEDSDTHAEETGDDGSQGAENEGERGQSPRNAVELAIVLRTGEAKADEQGQACIEKKETWRVLAGVQ